MIVLDASVIMNENERINVENFRKNILGKI